MAKRRSIGKAGIRNHSGIFEHLQNRATFIDRLELGVWGKRRARPSGTTRIVRTLAIGGPDRIYSRAAHGQCHATGNPFQFRYGVRRWFGRVPPYRLVLYSDQTPLTFAQVVLVMTSLMCLGFRVQVSRLEVTFDLTGTSVEFFMRHALTRARRRRILRDQSGRRTLYLGGPRSHWQLCVYVKSKSVTRFEFRLRLGALRKMGIRQPHEIVFLRKADLLGQLVSVHEVNETKLPGTDDGDDLASARARVIRKWAKEFSCRSFYASTKGCEIFETEWCRPCQIERKLRYMQDRLVW